MHGLLQGLRTSLLLRCALVALLLSCMGIGVFGEWLVFYIIRSDIRHEIKERIEASAPEASLVLVKIAKDNPPKNFQFTEAGREFRYKGQMYDIVRQEVKNDSILYYCIHDIRESQLYAKVEQQLQDEFSTSPQHQTKHRELIKKIPDFYLPSIHSIFLGFTCYTQQPDEAHLVWLDALLTIDAPPPEII